MSGKVSGTEPRGNSGGSPSCAAHIYGRCDGSPEEDRSLPLKYVTKFEYGDALAQDVRGEGTTPVFGSNGVVGSHDVANTLAPSIIIGRKGSFGKVTWADMPAFCIDTAYYIDKRHTKANLRWLYWMLQTLGLDMFSEDTGVPGLSREKAYRVHVPYPPLPEQTRIANFLDEQTARIDALIAEKERLVEVLHELMVSRLAFEMGGGANASIKTHYEWYPAIPLAWKVIPFKYAVRFVEGPGILAQDFRDEGVPLLRVSSLRGALATLDGCNYLDPVKVAKVWSHFRVKRGDLLISASATMGTVSLVTEDAEGAVPYTGIIILRPDESIAIRDFVRSFVISDQFMRQIDSMKAGATIQHFGPTHLNRVVMAVPESVAEQVVVAARLERWREAYEKSVASITAHVLSLREYRSSMISAAVTGQLDIDSFEKGVA